MRRLLQTSFLFALVTGAPPLQARAGWTDYARVGELIATGRHYFEVHLPVDDPSGCRAANRFYQNYDAPGASQGFELLLESLESGVRVRVYVTGVCNLNGYAEISAVGASR